MKIYPIYLYLFNIIKFLVQILLIWEIFLYTAEKNLGRTGSRPEKRRGKARKGAGTREKGVLHRLSEKRKPFGVIPSEAQPRDLCVNREPGKQIFRLRSALAPLRSR